MFDSKTIAIGAVAVVVAGQAWFNLEIHQAFIRQDARLIEIGERMAALEAVAVARRKSVLAPPVLGHYP